jgi:hypothetical protein
MTRLQPTPRRRVVYMAAFSSGPKDSILVRAEHRGQPELGTTFLRTSTSVSAIDRLPLHARKMVERRRGDSKGPGSRRPAGSGSNGGSHGSPDGSPVIFIGLAVAVTGALTLSSHLRGVEPGNSPIGRRTCAAAAASIWAGDSKWSQARVRTICGSPEEHCDAAEGVDDHGHDFPRAPKTGAMSRG